MKKLLALICLVIILWPGYSQAQEKIYLPVIFKTGVPTVDNKWRIITPVASSNYVLNPSAETTANFSDVSGATTTRVTTYQKYGLYSYQVAAPAIGDGVSLTTSALTNVEHFVTARVRGNTNLLVTIGSATKRLKFVEKIDDSWSLYGAPFAAAQANGRTTLEITAAQPGTFYLDGVQVEPLAYWTTYIDGTQDGCEWLGSEHASISQRSALSKAGGKSVDFWEEYKFQVERVVGAGSAPRRLGVDSYAILPGGELNNEKIEPREFTIIGQFIADTESELHEKTQELEEAFFADDLQLTRIRFNGAKVQKEIAVRYGGGLEGDMPVVYCDDRSIDDGNWLKLNKFSQRAAIQLTAPNPFWLEVGESAAVLDTNDSATFRYVAGRLRSTGQWNPLGPPDAAGTYTNIRAIVEDDTYVYVGGQFTNFDNIANADNIVRWHKQDESWSALGTGMSSAVFALAIGPDGTLYAGGDFTTAGGGAANRVASWDGSSWSALGTGMDNVVQTLAIGPDGTLYAGGNFTTAGGGAANYIASWDGSSWSALSTGMNSTVNDLAIDPDGTLYAGGNFTTAGGGAANRVASWDGSSWSALGTGMDGSVQTLAIGPDGTLYAGGDFSTAGGGAAIRVASWNGSFWSALSTGMNNTVYSLAIGPDGTLYAGGFFTTAGGITTTDRIAFWNGYTWSSLDIDLPGSPIVYAIQIGRSDPTNNKLFDLFIGYTTTGTAYFGGLTSIDNDGTIVYPKVFFNRSGGTTATIYNLRSLRTGKELLFNYSLLDGETLVIDLSPKEQSIISDFFGSRPDAILANSDFGTWALLPDNNDVTSFVNVAGAPTITAYMLWRDSFSSY
jgi:hypothetical protein